MSRRHRNVGRSSILSISTDGIADVASALFYGLGAVAVLLGGIVALRRFVLERPQGESWDDQVSDCRVRRTNDIYYYSALVEVTNLSQSRQSALRVWAKLALPGEDDFSRPIPPIIRTHGEAEDFFGKYIAVDADELGHGELFRFGQGVSAPRLFHIVRVFYCFEARRRRTLLPGWHKETALHPSARFVPVNLDDLKFYEEQK